jgi:uncharacterized protein (TIGR00297 family)
MNWKAFGWIFWKLSIRFDSFIMALYDILIGVFLLLAAILSFVSRKLTLTGAATGLIVGLLVYKGAGLTGIAMLALFFVAGSWATGWQVSKKKAIGFAEQNKGQRTASQVLANGGAAALLGALAWYLPDHAAILQVMMAGSLAAATADTLSSELGTVYGSRFFNILSLRTDERGRDGVISIEGTLIGAAGAMLIAAIYIAGYGPNHFLIIVIAGIIGNLADSLLGAALERKGLIGNNQVNFLNTLTGALVCWLLL